jgi:hypothetical protein
VFQRPAASIRCAMSACDLHMVYRNSVYFSYRVTFGADLPHLFFWRAEAVMLYSLRTSTLTALGTSTLTAVKGRPSKPRMQVRILSGASTFS